MLSRFLPRSSNLRLLSSITSKIQSYPPPLAQHHPRQEPAIASFLRHFSSNHGNGGKTPKMSDPWNLPKENDGNFDRLFNEESSGDIAGISDRAEEKGEAEDDWLTADGFEPWKLGEDEVKDDLFDFSEGAGGIVDVKAGDGGVGGLKAEMNEEQLRALENEEKELTDIVKGPNRAFGDLIAISGITDDMLDSLIALKDFEGIEGLPPLSVIEDIRYEKNTKKSTRAEIERQKQEEIAKSRVRKVDDKGRAYGTGRRKCSIARVWIQPGSGKFSVNDKEFDVYFPMLDHRAALLRPFSETKTLGLWDVSCTVKGGGTTGQVGAIRLGISRALQCWEPDLRPALRAAGFLTRDSRVVERKKPGKAKARKSFQWVKR
ncbi:hypothetical protein SAY87_016540 [Trapa incisa]|uniref:30S ribosomal protein S9 n=1 Tax=Trapa incisa TaxID=236973 RepID=A0AAN7LA87_9MYRT|nr:hypothetical protein SAY87_016540 [Trapa incisa]